MRRHPIDGREDEAERSVRGVERKRDAHDAWAQELVSLEQRSLEARRGGRVDAEEPVRVGAGAEAAAARLHAKQVVQHGAYETPVQLQAGQGGGRGGGGGALRRCRREDDEGHDGGARAGS